MGVRVEDKIVFADTHRLVLEWLRNGVIDGVRIDHPDGLRDPEEYFRRLRKAAPDGWIVAEKIVHPGERLPSTWPVEGTTGYDFLNIVGGLFIDPSGEESMTQFYATFTGEQTDYHLITREKKHQVLRELLASDVNRLTQLMVRICERHRRYRDYSRWEIHETLHELIARFPVYRSYVRVDAGEVREEDRKVISETVDAAKTFRPDLDPDLFDFLRALLLLEIRGEIANEWVMRFQQLTGPAAAKGIEDTAFYCFNRMIALNEVGGDPSLFGVSLDVFHRSMLEAANRHPHGMLATSTHDTKRSEDVRARLASPVRNPRPVGRGGETLVEDHNEQYRSERRPGPQHRISALSDPRGGMAHRDRTGPQLHGKGGPRSQGPHLLDQHVDAGYEKPLFQFVEAVLGDPQFVSGLETFVSSLVEPGRINSLSQVLIKLTAPGVPDFYQGTELWDLSLVDPDNRRPIDFDLRRRLLAGGQKTFAGRNFWRGWMRVCPSCG